MVEHRRRSSIVFGLVLGLAMREAMRAECAATAHPRRCPDLTEPNTVRCRPGALTKLHGSMRDDWYHIHNTPKGLSDSRTGNPLLLAANASIIAVHSCSKDGPERTSHALRSSAIRAWVAIVIASLVLGVVTMLAYGLGPFYPLKVVLTPIALGVFSLPTLHLHRPHTTIGPANAVTLCRCLLVGLVAGLIGEDTAWQLPWHIGIIATVAAATDSLDGYVARKCGVSSDFGAQLDMELDAILVLVLSVLLIQGERGPLWLLTAGLARYAFSAAGFLWPWLRAPLTPSPHRKLGVVAHVYTSSLVCLPICTAEMAWSAGLVAANIVLVSFWIDISDLYRRRHDTRAPSARRS